MVRQRRLELAIQAAVSSGKILLSHYGKFVNVKTKESLRDVITRIDLLSEENVIQCIQKQDPSAMILSEEKGQTGKTSDCYWVVDALDGTVNYVNQVPLFCVSIAYVENHKPVAGAVYNPLSQDLYYGSIESGVYKNQQRITVKNKPYQDILMGVAFSGRSYNPPERGKEFHYFGKLNDQSRGCLRTGSAAMNLCYVAEGKFGACWGKANKYWDIAAGLLFAQLAGATVSFTEPDQNYLVHYLASVPDAWKFLSRELGQFLYLPISSDTSK